MVLATEVQGSAPTRALLLLAVVGGVLWAVWKVLGVGRRGGRLPPGGLFLVFFIFLGCLGFFKPLRGGVNRGVLQKAVLLRCKRGEGDADEL